MQHSVTAVLLMSIVGKHVQFNISFYKYRVQEFSHYLYQSIRSVQWNYITQDGAIVELHSQVYHLLFTLYL